MVPGAERQARAATDNEEDKVVAARVALCLGDAWHQREHAPLEAHHVAQHHAPEASAGAELPRLGLGLVEVVCCSSASKNSSRQLEGPVEEDMCLVKREGVGEGIE